MKLSQHRSHRCRVSLIRVPNVLISEVYVAPQGEGEFAGTSSVFVRTTGCNLRCWYCDTPFTSWTPEGHHISLFDLIEQIVAFETEHVVLTGGEPMLPLEISELTQRLRDRGHFITVETAGTIYRPVAADLMSISPKLGNSTPSPERSRLWATKHDALRDRPKVIAKLIQESPYYQIKFVINEPTDLADVESYLSRFPNIDRQRVWLMPQAISQAALAERTAWLEPQARSAGLRFSSRLHIAQHGNRRGT